MGENPCFVQTRSTGETCFGHTRGINRHKENIGESDLLVHTENVKKIIIEFISTIGRALAWPNKAEMRTGKLRCVGGRNAEKVDRKSRRSANERLD